MALLDSEGFGFSNSTSDYVTYGLFNTLNGGSITAAGPLGDNWYNMTFSGANAVRLFPEAITSGIVGTRLFIVKSSNGGGPSQLYIRSSVGNAQFFLAFNTTSQIIQVYRGILGSSPVLLGSTSGVTFINSAWCYLEVKFTISTTVGAIEIQVNGASVLTLTGINNADDTVNVNAAAIVWQNAQYDTLSFMHYYLCDQTGGAPWNTFLGDIRVQTVLPISNNAVEFAPTGMGANWQNVSQVPPVPASDYNSSSTVGDVDTFNCASISTSAVTVYGVHVKGVFAKSNSGARFAQTVLTSGGTTETGVSTALSTSPMQVKTIYEVDPNTSAQWTVPAVNTIKAGYEVSG